MMSLIYEDIGCVFVATYNSKSTPTTIITQTCTCNLLPAAPKNLVFKRSH